MVPRASWAEEMRPQRVVSAMSFPSSGLLTTNFSFSCRALQAARIIAQLLVSGGTILFRSAAQAYRQAIISKFEPPSAPLSSPTLELAPGAPLSSAAALSALPS